MMHENTDCYAYSWCVSKQMKQCIEARKATFCLFVIKSKIEKQNLESSNNRNNRKAKVKVGKCPINIQK